MRDEVKLLKAISEKKHLKVAEPNVFIDGEVFFHWGYPLEIKNGFLILETARGPQAIALDRILYIEVSENSFKKNWEQRKSNKKKYQGWEY